MGTTWDSLTDLIAAMNQKQDALGPVPGTGRYILLILATVISVPCYALLATQVHPAYAYSTTVCAYCCFVDLWTKRYLPWAIPVSGIACGLLLYLYIIINDTAILRMLGPWSIMLVLWSTFGILPAMVVCLGIRLIKFCVNRYL